MLMLMLMLTPREVVRSLVGEVIAVDARQDNVAQPPIRDGLCHLLRLVGVQRRGRAAGLDGAKAVPVFFLGGGGGRLEETTQSTEDMDAGGGARVSWLSGGWVSQRHASLSESWRD